MFNDYQVLDLISCFALILKCPKVTLCEHKFMRVCKLILREIPTLRLDWCPYGVFFVLIDHYQTYTLQETTQLKPCRDSLKWEAVLLEWIPVNSCLCAPRMQGTVGFRKDSCAKRILFATFSYARTNCSVISKKISIMTKKSLLFGTLNNDWLEMMKIMRIIDDWWWQMKTHGDW